AHCRAQSGPDSSDSQRSVRPTWRNAVRACGDRRGHRRLAVCVPIEIESNAARGGRPASGASVASSGTDDQAAARLQARRARSRAELHLLVRSAERLEAALAANPDSFTLDCLVLFGLRPAVQRVKSGGIAVRVASPRILKTGESRIVDFLGSLDCPILVRAAGT